MRRNRAAGPDSDQARSPSGAGRPWAAPAPARPPAGAPPPGRRRRALQDNPRLLLAAVLLLLGALVGLIALADRSAELSPDFLIEVVLYALVAIDLTMLVALAFLLARNIIKLVVEQRRALPFARFRAKLVAVLLGLTLVPAVLVLIVGSELIRNSADRWFAAPVDEVLTSANQIASDYYAERQARVTEYAEQIAQLLGRFDLEAEDLTAVRDAIAPGVTAWRVGLVEVYRLTGEAGERRLVPLVEVASPMLPRGYSRAASDRLAGRVAAGQAEPRALEPMGDGGELIRAVALIPGEGAPRGVVVTSEYLTGELAANARRITAAYEGYHQLRVLKGPLQGVYLSFFVMVTLLILVSATWTGLYLAKRITGPIQRLAQGAREIGAGHLDHRIEAQTNDELGTLVDAFNTMAGELAASQRKLERSRVDLERKNLEIEGRRRYIETILERIATGVVSIDPDGRISTANSAACRLLGLDPALAGQPASAVFGRPDLQALGGVLEALGRGRGEPAVQEVAIARDGREVHLAVAATRLRGGDSTDEGTVMVFDDVTPLIRAQRVAAWRDVARRLAHEIKNPLTPIQLCAERLRRHFGGAVEPTRALVDECTSTIVGEVESLKGLVDEFSQFARMPAPRTVPSDLNALVTDTLALYHGLFERIRIERRLDPDLPPVRVDPEQIRRVVINLVDNAVEALNGAWERAGGRGVIAVETTRDAGHGVARIVIADNGPGIPAADREKLFMPYYSTKRRGSGLGLAIVRRIVVEHGGSIEVSGERPTGTRFTIELPC